MTLGGYAQDKVLQQNYWEYVERRLKDSRNDETRDDFGVLQPKIQKVPTHLRARNEFADYFRPNIIAIGPLHQDTAPVLGGEYKIIWTASYLKETNHTYDHLMERFADQDLYSFFSKEITIDWYFFNSMMLVDGCSILHVLDKSVDSFYPTFIDGELQLPEITVMAQQLLCS
ncbi:hypothetical protein SESBI_37712 [Sesbania bispinosa]|nr:hypothetical protein SESBI_37712 [Sesbania bispinosa]